MIRIFIGKDDVENVAYHTLCNSIINKATVPVSITPIYLNNFKEFFNRERDIKQSNEFAFSRFLVPYLCGFQGHAIWMDCDMMLRADINDLWEQRMFDKALQVVKHDYTPHDQVKYLGAKQYPYEKKNWSSVILWNCAHFHTRRLTPEYITQATGLNLHQFKWTEEDRIGNLSQDWNHLVGEYPYNPDAKLVHWTVGGPYFKEYAHCDYADEWVTEFAEMTNCLQLDEI
tara:strand:- start:15043 stop:15729 length:687 start_codon:yes stop_codon:yes gene_type:complete